MPNITSWLKEVSTKLAHLKQIETAESACYETVAHEYQKIVDSPIQPDLLGSTTEKFVRLQARFGIIECTWHAMLCRMPTEEKTLHFNSQLLANLTQKLINLLNNTIQAVDAVKVTPTSSKSPMLECYTTFLNHLKQYANLFDTQCFLLQATYYQHYANHCLKNIISSKNFTAEIIQFKKAIHFLEESAKFYKRGKDDTFLHKVQQTISALQQKLIQIEKQTTENTARLSIPKLTTILKIAISNTPIKTRSATKRLACASSTDAAPTKRKYSTSLAIADSTVTQLAMETHIERTISTIQKTMDKHDPFAEKNEQRLVSKLLTQLVSIYISTEEKHSATKNKQDNTFYTYGTLRLEKNTFGKELDRLITLAETLAETLVANKKGNGFFQSTQPKPFTVFLEALKTHLETLVCQHHVPIVELSNICDRIIRLTEYQIAIFPTDTEASKQSCSRSCTR